MARRKVPTFEQQLLQALKSRDVQLAIYDAQQAIDEVLDRLASARPTAFERLARLRSMFTPLEALPVPEVSDSAPAPARPGSAPRAAAPRPPRRKAARSAPRRGRSR